MSQEGVIVIGAGGHAKVCIESLVARGMRVAFCIGTPSDSDTCLHVPVLKDDSHLQRLTSEGYVRVFVALGQNSLRRRLGEKVQNLGMELVNAIHPAATVSPSAVIGSGVAVMAGAVINAAAEIGDFAIINTGASVDHDCLIGEAAHVAPQCGLAGCVTLGDEVFLGIGTRVIPNIVIGRSTTVGAGSVVIRNTPENCKVVGVPSRPIA